MKEEIASDLASKIIESIKRVDPYKIIIFGSYAWGIPHKDSDIDLSVVLKKEQLPESFDERVENYCHVK